MLDYYRSAVARPEIDAYLRRAHEARAAAFYGAYHSLAKGVSAGLGFIASLPGRLGRWHVKRITIRELSALDGHQLADIGLSRHEIPGIAAALSGTSYITLPKFRARSRWDRAVQQTVRGRGQAAHREPANENSAAIGKLRRAA